MTLAFIFFQVGIIWLVIVNLIIYSGISEQDRTSLKNRKFGFFTYTRINHRILYKLLLFGYAIFISGFIIIILQIIQLDQ